MLPTGSLAAALRARWCRQASSTLATAFTPGTARALVGPATSSGKRPAMDAFSAFAATAPERLTQPFGWRVVDEGSGGSSGAAPRRRALAADDTEALPYAVPEVQVRPVAPQRASCLKWRVYAFPVVPASQVCHEAVQHCCLMLFPGAAAGPGRVRRRAGGGGGVAPSSGSRVISHWQHPTPQALFLLHLASSTPHAVPIDSPSFINWVQMSISNVVACAWLGGGRG